MLDAIPSIVSFALQQDLQVENCRARGSSCFATALTATRFFSAGLTLKCQVLVSWKVVGGGVVVGFLALFLVSL